MEFPIKSNTGRQHLNVNAAVNIDSLESVCRFNNTKNGEATIDLCKAIEELYPKAGTIHIICDNAHYYRSKVVSQFLETSRIELVFLPPYAPNLNLIERYWRYFKKVILYNHYYETSREFKTASEDFFSEAKSWSTICTRYQLRIFRLSVHDSLLYFLCVKSTTYWQ